MRVIIARNAGFCFGVRRAVETVYDILGSKNADTAVFTLGKLIHNPHITEELNARGVGIIESGSEEGDILAIRRISAEAAQKKRKAIVVIRAHGTTAAREETLSACSFGNPYFEFVDCTCPYVKNIHRIVAENSDADTDTVIIGDARHPEVEGICSRAHGQVTVYADAEALSKANFLKKRVVMAAQTTQKLTEWKKCQNIIRKLCTNSKIFDTICNVTETRQTEADVLSKNVDLMLVVGARDSSNTRKLYDTARHNLEKTFLIENIQDLPSDEFRPGLTVGITAGASTPGSIIEEVINNMNPETDVTTEASRSVETENFAAMLEDSLKTLNTGETVKGTITFVSPNEIHVDLKAKVTGIIPVSEITDNPTFKVEENYKVGDEIEAYVVKVSDVDGVATLSRRRVENVINWRNILEAYKNETVLDGKVIEAVKGGVIMLLSGMRVFVPASQTGLPKDTDLSVLVGAEKKAKIIDVNEQRRRAVASIKAVEREERKKLEAEFWANVEEGKWYEGVVKSLTSYGAFVDLGGVDGMVHSTELSWKRIHHPSEVVSVGDKINVYVKSFYPETKRISLGYKTDDTNPWNIFTSQYNKGDIVAVKILSMLPFGAFAEVIPGADGLIHISQISNEKISQPSDVLSIGQIVNVKITDIDYENHKISLSIKAAAAETEADDEAAPAEEAPADAE